MANQIDVKFRLPPNSTRGATVMIFSDILTTQRPVDVYGVRSAN